jgi:hypothetical protein
MGSYNIPFHTDVQGAEKLHSLEANIASLARVHGLSTQKAKEFTSAINEEIAGGRRLEGALREAASAQGGFDKSTQSVSKALLDQIKMTQLLEKETEKLRQAELRAHEQQQRQAGQVPSLTGRLGGRLLGSDIGSAVGIPGLGRFGGSLIGASGMSGGAMLAIGGGVAAATMLAHEVKEIENLGKWVQEQRNAAAAIGITTQQMETLTRVSERTGVNMNAAAKSAFNLGEELTRGGPKAREIQVSLKELGLTTAVAFENSYNSINDIAKALSRIPDHAERVRVAVQLLGESGRAVAEVADKLASTEGKVKILDPAQEANLIAAKNAMDEFGHAWDDLKAKAAVPLTFTLNIVGKVMGVESGIYGAVAGGGKGGSLKERITSNVLHALGYSTQPEQDAAAKEQARDNEVAGQTAARVKNLQTFRAPYLTPSARAAADKAAVDIQEESLTQRYVHATPAGTAAEKLIPGLFGPSVNEKQARQGIAGFEQQKRNIEETEKAREKAISETRSQRERLQKLPPPKDAKEALAQAALLSGAEFNRLQNDPALVARRADTATWLVGLPEDPAARLRRLGTVGGGIAQPHTGGFASLQAEGIGPHLEQAQKASAHESAVALSNLMKDQSRDTREFQENQKALEEDTMAQEKMRAAIEAARTGMARRTMSPITSARQQLADTQRKIQDETFVKTAPLQGTVDEAARISALPSAGKDEQRTLDTALANLNRAEIEGKTKSIEAIAKFNEAIAESAEKMKENFAHGFASFIMGAQSGKAGDAFKNLATGFERTVLTNLGGVLWSGKDGKGGIGATIGKMTGADKRDPDSFMGKLLQGTFAGARGKPEDVPLIDSNVRLQAATDRSADAADRLANVLSSLSLGGITARANGGPLRSGQTTMVGEKGPELFVPDVAGSIIPNHMLRFAADGAFDRAALLKQLGLPESWAGNDDPALKFAKSFGSEINPLNWIKGAVHAVTHPAETLVGMNMPLIRAAAAFKAGNPAAAMAHLAANSMPFGNAIDDAGVKVSHGQVAEAFGSLAGQGAAILGQNVLIGGAIKAAPEFAKIGGEFLADEEGSMPSTRATRAVADRHARSGGQGQGMNFVRPEKRIAIYQRDNNQCLYCGKNHADGPAYHLTLDHVITDAKGGTNEATNLATSCHRHNSMRGNKPLSQFAREIAGEVGKTPEEIVKTVRKQTKQAIDVPAAKLELEKHGGFSATVAHLTKKAKAMTGAFMADEEGSIPGKANGGPLHAGELTMVGERGPELFVPKTAGSIIPNEKLRFAADGAMETTDAFSKLATKITAGVPGAAPFAALASIPSLVAGVLTRNQPGAAAKTPEGAQLVLINATLQKILTVLQIGGRGGAGGGTGGITAGVAGGIPALGALDTGIATSDAGTSAFPAGGYSDTALFGSAATGGAASGISDGATFAHEAAHAAGPSAGGSSAGGSSAGGSSIWGNLAGDNGAGAQVGAGMGVAAAGFGAFQGIKQATKGGAHNITAGIGETAMAVAPLTGPAAPFVMAAGLILEGISKLLPDPRVTRQREITREMANDRFNRPDAVNVIIDSSGKAVDRNFRGGLEVSNGAPRMQFFNQATGFDPLHPDQVVTKLNGYVGTAPIGAPPTVAPPTGGFNFPQAAPNPYTDAPRDMTPQLTAQAPRGGTTIINNYQQMQVTSFDSKDVIAHADSIGLAMKRVLQTTHPFNAELDRVVNPR